jgi:hypothetical protein
MNRKLSFKGNAHITVLTFGGIQYVTSNLAAVLTLEGIWNHEISLRGLRNDEQSLQGVQNAEITLKGVL